jgi:hypothetical protein
MDLYLKKVDGDHFAKGSQSSGRLSLQLAELHVSLRLPSLSLLFVAIIGASCARAVFLFFLRFFFIISLQCAIH